MYRREILKYMNNAFKHYCLTSFCTTKFITLILQWYSFFVKKKRREKQFFARAVHKKSTEYFQHYIFTYFDDHKHLIQMSKRFVYPHLTFILDIFSFSFGLFCLLFQYYITCAEYETVINIKSNISLF